MPGIVRCRSTKVQQERHAALAGPSPRSEAGAGSSQRLRSLQRRPVATVSGDGPAGGLGHPQASAVAGVPSHVARSSEAGVPIPTMRLNIHPTTSSAALSFRVAAGTTRSAWFAEGPITWS